MPVSAAFIFAGVGLIRRFHWIIYGFGLLLVYSGIRLLFQRGAEVIQVEFVVLTGQGTIAGFSAPAS